jgi:uncharacterized protein YndB with AHSA1/START domain
MAARSNASAEAAELELVITRTLDAPRTLVFEAWTQPERLKQWWGPRGFTLPACDLDLRPGGAYRFHMRSPEGTDHWSQGVFREIVPPERLVMAGCWVDALGKPKGPETVVTITLEDDGGRTRLTLHQTGFESVTARDEHRSGWSSSFECLAEYIAQLQ